ncbi:16164_t:CDS:10 [Entrophospora sp. SA101]|nr:1126_t:CDS:10 [Entrophospora sp. SA101]CAJ0649141.1 16164_t:CDS:10 [Entrophospora sp. SA101]
MQDDDEFKKLQKHDFLSPFILNVNSVKFGTKELDLNNIQHDLHNNKPIEKSINAFSDTADLTDFYSKLIRHCKIGIKEGEVTNVEILSYILLLTEGEDLANSIQGKSGYKTDVGLSGLVIDIPLNKSKFYCDVKFENELWSYNPQLDLLVMRKQDDEYIYPCILGETKSNESDRYMSKISLKTSKLVSEDSEDLHPIISIYVDHSLFEVYITYYNDILKDNMYFRCIWTRNLKEDSEYGFQLAHILYNYGNNFSGMIQMNENDNLSNVQGGLMTGLEYQEEMHKQIVREEHINALEKHGYSMFLWELMKYRNNIVPSCCEKDNKCIIAKCTNKNSCELHLLKYLNSHLRKHKDNHTIKLLDILEFKDDGVAFLHQVGIAHCDLNPRNITCDEEEHLYIASEVSDHVYYDPFLADVWSVGKVMHIMGQYLKLPIRFKNFVESLLVPDFKRPTSIEAFENFTSLL